MTTIESYFLSLSLIEAGILASLIAGLATGIGALPIFVVRSVSARLNDALLGVAAGLMLGASVFSLILPALVACAARTGSEIPATLNVAASILAGGMLLWLVHRVLPHEHFVKGREGLDGARVKGLWLFATAITVHNFPEGLAIGVGFGGGDVGNGLALTAAIFLQNLPEGFAVALAMLALDYRPSVAVIVALLTGLAETGACVRGRDHAVRNQPRDHPRNAPQRPRDRGHVRRAVRIHTDDVAGRRHRLSGGGFHKGFRWSGLRLARLQPPVSVNATVRPIWVPWVSSSRITMWPRITVAAGQPVTFMPSNGVQPHLLAIQSLAMMRFAFRSTIVKSPS
jgi:ZIP family zinc transporter